MESLVARGSRRFVTFLAPAIVSPEPMFGLGTLEDIIPILYEEGVVNILRRYVSEAGLNPDHLIIRYKHTKDPMDNDPEAWVRDSRAKALQEKLAQTILAEFPVQMNSNHEPESLLDQDVSVEKNGQADKLNTTTSSRKRPLNAAPLEYRGTLPNKKSKRFKGPRPFRRDGIEYATISPVSRDGAAACHERWIEFFEIAEERFDELQLIKENIQYFPTGTIMQFDELNLIWRADYGEDVNDATWELHQGHIPEDRHYTFLVGIPEIGAIYRKVDADVDLQDDLEIHEVKAAFEVRDVNPKRFLEHLSNLDKEKGKRNRFQPSPLVRSLRGVAAVTGVYKIMPNATITTSVFTKQFHEALWLDDTSSKPHTETTRSLTQRTPGGNAANEMTDVVHELQSQAGSNFEWLLKYPMNRSRSFACIAMFENASLNIDPQGLGEVMALSAANSIYVAMPLLCDPYVQPHEHEVKHVIGNIGRPGVTFMVPPPNPMARKDDGWDLAATHLPFDGSFGDKFKSSSLHLSFTKYQIPLSQTRDGGQDIEACFLQSLVRLHGPDGKWVADLDVLGSLNSPQFQRLTNPKLVNCKHEKSRKQKPAIILKSIDSWAAFLDRPKLPGIVRATGNWLARLAAASLNVQLGYPVLVLPDDLEYYCQEGGSEKKCIKDNICWACVVSHFNLEPRKTGSTLRYQNNYKLESMPFFIA